MKERKHVTNRIVTKEDIENVLTYIAKAEREGRISLYQAQQFTGSSSLAHTRANEAMPPRQN